MSSNVGAIIVRGEQLPIDAVVHTWLETGWHFLGRTRPTTRAVVNHWTGAENAPERVYRSLREHRDVTGRPEPLSVHFVIDQLGELYQFCDTETRCSHCAAQGANGWSIGIELINRGSSFGVPDRGFVRLTRTETIHGDLMYYAAFLPIQIEMACRLNEVLCRAYGLPQQVPQKEGDVYSGVLPLGYTARYKGVLGHLQLEPRKVDPGLELLRAIHARGTTPPLVA